jgi:hypothetical protein
MRIYFERSGGFAGMLLSTTVDTDSLSQEEALYFQSTFEETGFFELPARLSAPQEGADRFQYRLTVETGERQHTVELSDASAPDDLRPLLDRLTSLARSRQR